MLSDHSESVAQDGGVVGLHVKEGHFFTPPKRVTSPIWGPPPSCIQALTHSSDCFSDKKLASVYPTEVHTRKKILLSKKNEGKKIFFHIQESLEIQILSYLHLLKH